MSCFITQSSFIPPPPTNSCIHLSLLIYPAGMCASCPAMKVLVILGWFGSLMTSTLANARSSGMEAAKAMTTTSGQWKLAGDSVRVLQGSLHLPGVGQEEGHLVALQGQGLSSHVFSLQDKKKKRL